MIHWIPHFPAARYFPVFLIQQSCVIRPTKKNPPLSRNDNTRVPLIKNSRRFYILMRRTTISHFSFLMQAKLSNRSKGRYAPQAYFNPKSKNVPHSEDVFLIYALLSLILNTNEPTRPERMDAVTIAAFAEVSSAGSAKESEARKMDIVNPIPARMLAPK